MRPSRFNGSILRLAAPIALVPAMVVVFVSLGAAQVYTVQQSFTQAEGFPGAVEPAQGRDGRLYGTYSDDQTVCGGGAFRAPEGTGPMTIFNFSASECNSPYGGLTLATDGNFYGATSNGGTYDVGTLFRMTPGGAVTILYNFSNQGDGGGPIAAPIQSSDGNFYGTTSGVFNVNNGQISGSIC